ncbi:MAG TPA: hypothetical protein VHN99_00255 [Deinococcales bacterium]|nr:hypothetical protein [Deinococcales bacterium]
MISAIAGAILAASGLLVLALLPRVTVDAQRRVLRPVALLDLTGGVLVLLLGLVGVLP